MSLVRTVGKSLSVAVVVVLALYPIARLRRHRPLRAERRRRPCSRPSAWRGSWFSSCRGRPAFGGASLVLVCVGGILLAAVSYWRGSTVAVLYYPALVNAALLVVFAASLFRPPSVVERIARLRDPELPPAAVVYTRRVTLAWTVFFALNGAAALYTARFTPLETWALYNGLIAYLLIGALFAVELAIRSVVKRRFIS